MEKFLVNRIIIIILDYNVRLEIILYKYRDQL